MLLQHGSFESVEVELVKRSTQLAQNEQEGGWENEVSLGQEGWTELHSMHDVHAYPTCFKYCVNVHTELCMHAKVK